MHCARPLNEASNVGLAEWEQEQERWKGRREEEKEEEEEAA